MRIIDITVLAVLIDIVFLILDIYHVDQIICRV